MDATISAIAVKFGSVFLVYFVKLQNSFMCLISRPEKLKFEYFWKIALRLE